MLEPLLNDCRNLIKAFSNCTVTHIFREAKRCIDKLVNIEAIQTSDFFLLYEPPFVVDNLLAFDKVELFYNRLIVT